MFNFFAKIILTVIVLLLIILILFFSYNSLSENEIQGKIDKCYDKNNDLLLSNISKMEKGESGKKTACLFWKEAISDLNLCVKKAYKIPDILIESTDTTEKIQKLKEKQNSTCKEYPDTLVKKEELIRFKLFGRDLILNLTPLVLSRGIPLLR